MIMSSRYDFTGILALVTGGASGMGRVVAQKLADSGATVIVADINADGASQTVQMMKGTGHTAFKLDVSSETSVKELANSILAKYNRCPAIVMHAAGVMASLYRSIFEIDQQDLNRVLDINLKGTFYIDKTFGQLMRDHKIKNGAIVNFASIAGRVGLPFVANYCASKAGVISLTESFAKELAETGIRVNGVAPFFVDTPMLGHFEQEVVKQITATCPSKRVGTSEEIADVCLFLASKDSSYITGQTINVTGGF